MGIEYYAHFLELDKGFGHLCPCLRQFLVLWGTYSIPYKFH